MDSHILRLLIFSLLVTFSLCLVPLETTLSQFNGSLASSPQVTVLPVFNFTGYPGQAQVQVQGPSSVAVCVSPYVAITTNIAVNCPNVLNFFYADANPMNEFLLFLDDFSMNFMGQNTKDSGRVKSQRDSQLSIPPYEPQTIQITLLQDVPYYVTLSLIDYTGNNDTLRDTDFTLNALYPICGAGTVPNSQYGRNVSGSDVSCYTVEAPLTPTNFTSQPLTVSNLKPVVFSFQITATSSSAQLHFLIDADIYNFTIYFGFEYAPSALNFDFNYTSSGNISNEVDILEGVNYQTFNVTIPNPQFGTYYAQVNSASEIETSFAIEFNTTTCDLSEGQCGNTQINTTLSTDMSVQNVTLTSTPVYFGITGDTAVFGIDVNGTGGEAFVQVGVNSIPTGAPVNASTTLFQYLVDTSLALTLNGVDSNDDFVFALENGQGINLGQATFQALVWTGSICPSNCSSKGTCNTDTYQCTCSSGYQGRYCQVETPSHKKKLSTLYIILIIIGGAILLAILIGVPVALFLNNRKKARYERV